MQPRSAVRRLAFARLASTGGTQAAQIALAYVIYDRTGSAAWVSAALVASGGVVGLVGPLSGRISDRFDRKRVMVAAELAGAAGWLLVLLAPSPALLVAATLLATAANAPFRSASSSALPNLVPPDLLPWANGVLATAVNASLVVGPLAGGALVGSAGARWVFGVNVVTFVVSAAAIGRVHGRFGEGALDDAGLDPIAAVRWRDLLADPLRRRLYAVTALTFAAFGTTLVADLPLVDHFDGGSVAYALLTTLWGSGAIVGSAVAGRFRPSAEARALVLGTLAMAVSLGSIAFAPNLPVAIAVGAIGGVGSGVAFPPWFSLLQRCTPDRQRGTAFAMADTFEQSAFIAGMVVAGAVIGLVGAQPTYLVPGALLGVAAGLARAVLGRQPSLLPAAQPSS